MKKFRTEVLGQPAQGLSIQRGHVVAREGKGNLIELWLPPVDHSEGELICSFDQAYLSDMIAGLVALKQMRRRR